MCSNAVFDRSINTRLYVYVSFAVTPAVVRQWLHDFNGKLEEGVLSRDTSMFRPAMPLIGLQYCNANKQYNFIMCCLFQKVIGNAITSQTCKPMMN
jgi:hypothetical protein